MMSDLMFVLGYAALAVVLAILIGSAIVNRDDDWPE